MASAAGINHALRNMLIELQGWTLVLLLCSSCLLGGVNPQELPKEEMDALQALKRAWNTSTPNFDTTFETWNSSHPCWNSSSRTGGWVGVSCDFNSTWPTGVTVTKLRLSLREIVGVLPSEVSKLGNLEWIAFWNHKGLFGPIPKGLVQLRYLTQLVLNNNMFNGEFPFSSIINGSKLQYLDISSNQFNGTIKEGAFWNLRQLYTLELNGNMFSGEFPFRSITNGSRISWLSIANNCFNGTIGEDAFQNLGQLNRLDLSNNMFSGEFPFKFIINGSNLLRLNISNNCFNGTIGADGFWDLGQLIELDLSSNGFRGQLPNVSKMKKLQKLFLDSNNFTGQAPDISNLNELFYLNLSRNKFEGQTPTLLPLTSLVDLDLSKNKFTGQAPVVSKMVYLQILDLSENGFTGSAPDVSNLTHLRDLDLSRNNFTGHLPTLSSNLRHINLSSNHFTELSNDLLPFLNNLYGPLNLLDLSNVQVGGGPVPYFANLNLPMSLSELYLDKNNFTGILNVSAILESNASRTLKVLSLKDNMIADINGHDSSIINYAIGLTKIALQGNPYCKKTWTSQDDTRICNFYCGDTCSKPKLPKKGRSILIMVSSISSVVAALVIFLVIVGFGFVLRGKEKYIQDLQKKIKDADVNAKRFDYNELRVATKNFAPEMKLGEGGFGAVYKGILAGNVVVAVKQLLLNTNASREDFVNEVLLISNLQHQNLVALKGYCLKDRQTLLVYEYVENCDLDKLLLSRQATAESTFQDLQLWKTRLKICQGVAYGLHYLHTFSQSRIIHRDIKASNILVNKNFEAKIADFGLARLIAGSVIETSQCAGTFGYLAPEYAREGQLSEKADVYSFGVLLLEIVSGMRNQDRRMPEDEMHLAIWAWKLHQSNRLLDMKDPSLIVSEDEAEEVQRVLETAMLCVQNNPTKRPAMILVAAMLAGKANGDELPPIDEELDDLWVDLASEESDCDVNPLFDSIASAMASLASRPTCNPQIELNSSRNAQLWRTG